MLSSRTRSLESVRMFIASLSEHRVLCAQALGSGWAGMPSCRRVTQQL